MDSRQRALAVLAVGVVLSLAPIYLQSAFAVGVGPVLDPIAAVGLLPAGVYPVAVGTGYLGAGVLALLFLGSQPLAYRPVVGAGFVATALSLVAAAVLLVTETESVVALASLPTVAYLFAAAVVPTAFLVGLATEAGRRDSTLVVVAVLLLPVLAVVARNLASGGSSLSVGAVVFAAGAVLVFGAFWAYPLYRLGRSFDVVVR